MRSLKIFFSCLFVCAVAGSAIAQEPLSADVQALLVQAKAGDADAQFRVASAYDFGKGAPRDGAEAMKWYRLAAAQGHADAQNTVGNALQAEKRHSEALPWYERASAQGHAMATNNLANLYDKGLGVRQDRQKAFALYTRAANLGWAESMWNIANMYGAGLLGKADLVMACIWTIRAGKFAGDNETQLTTHVSRVMPELARKLSTEQFASCKRRAEAWSPSADSAKADTQPGTAPGAPRKRGTPAR